MRPTPLRGGPGNTPGRRRRGSQPSSPSREKPSPPPPDAEERAAPGACGSLIPHGVQNSELVSFWNLQAGQYPSGVTSLTTPLHFPQFTHAYPQLTAAPPRLLDPAGLNRPAIGDAAARALAGLAPRHPHLRIAAEQRQPARRVLPARPRCPSRSGFRCPPERGSWQPRGRP